MPAFERAAVETSLAYPEDTAGRLMQREVVAAPEFWTVGQTIDHLRATREDLPSSSSTSMWSIPPSNPWARGGERAAAPRPRLHP
jgi:hypothetical protein